MAKAYFSDHQAAHDAANVYIANVDGKKAGLDINIPAENNWNAKHILPICRPNSLQTALKEKKMKEAISSCE